MKAIKTISLVLCIAGLAAVLICILTDWNDALFLPLGLFLSAATNALNILIARRTKIGKEAGK